MSEDGPIGMRAQSYAAVVVEFRAHALSPSDELYVYDCDSGE